MNKFLTKFNLNTLNFRKTYNNLFVNRYFPIGRQYHRRKLKTQKTNFKIENKEETNQSNAFSYKTKRNDIDLSNYIVLYSNKRPYFLLGFVVSIFVNVLAMMYFGYLALFGTENVSTSFIGYAAAFVFFSIGVLALSKFSKHFILEFGLVNPNLVRLVTGKYGLSYTERFIDANKIYVRDVTPILPGAEKLSKKERQFLFLALENEKLHYVMDIQSKHSYVNKKQMLDFFDTKTAKVRVIGGFTPFKNK